MKNINFLNKLLLLLCITLTVAIASCSDDDPPLPDNLVSFESAGLGMAGGEQGAAGSENELTVKVLLSRVVNNEVTLNISFVTEGVTYGTDFTTVPAASSNSLSLTVAKGSSEASFVISRTDDALLDGDEKVTFTITTATEPVLVGAQPELVLSFAEILSQGATIDINGGGATYANKVLIDLSANRQTVVERSAWDLGFYMDANDFRVILNSSVTMMARPLEKSDLNAVTDADTLDFANEMVLASEDAMPWIDNPDGDLTGTAVDAISATASENKVYIVNRGAGIGTPASHRGWKKFRVIRNGSGYTLQHADINATSYQEVQIEKDDQYLFKYIHFENGAVAVEPPKDKWDIAWTYFMNSIGGTLPYAYQDIVLQNRFGVESAKVLTSAMSYADFSESDLASLTFSNSQIAIGPDWRRTSPAPVVVFDDRFYIIKDADGNYFKLKFNLIIRDGVRGNPQFEFALVKEGD